MYTTYEQKLEILQMLMDEADTARRALRKAERQYDSTSDLVQRERAAVLMGTAQVAVHRDANGV